MPIPIAAELPPAKFTMRREHGVHEFPLASGGAVTVLSENSWDGFAARLGALENPGRYVLSPELITASPEPAPDEMAGLPATVARRVEHARGISARWPDTTLLLGSLTFAAAQERPRNELLFIRGGEVTGHTPKLPYLPGEAQVFHQAYDPREHQQPDRQTVGMVCSDILFHGRKGGYQEGLPGRDLIAEYVNPIGPGVRTVLVSGLWVTPHVPGHIKPAHEEARFVAPAQFYARALLLHNPGVQDVVMADQLPAGSPARGPLNFHARRL